uniref:EGF-like domain-containing protein n=1 Tax=Syphacia muris TaxID=451379 RepID=A0A0N5ASN5_9BILA
MLQHSEVLIKYRRRFPDRCTTVCENGGTVSSSCSCLCGYGFTGDRCQYLSKQHLFNDASCGIVNTSQVSLSAYPQPTRGPIFCQWLIRAPEANTIEFSIQDLDLDAEKVLQNQPCNDMFYIWGSKDISNPIPCNSESLESLIGKALKSDSNWLLIELRMNPWSEVAHKGPLIKFRYVTPSSLKVLRAYTSEMSLMSSSTIAPLPAATILLVILCIVFFPQQH